MLSWGARADVRSYSANHLYFVDLCTLNTPQVVDGRLFHEVLEFQS